MEQDRQSVLSSPSGERFFTISLLLLATVPFLSLLNGEFLYDDVRFLLSNPELYKIRNFFDCLSFSHQPSKPIANFFLGLGYWISQNHVFGQRFISILLHGGVVVLLFTNLRLLCRRTNSHRHLPFWISALFAVLPIHSETIAIAQFRGEILGTLFTLAMMLALQLLSIGRMRWLYFPFIYFFLAGLAQLSKELFALVIPLSAVLLFYLPSTKENWKYQKQFIYLVTLTAIFWSTITFLLYQMDVNVAHSYKGNIGWGVWTIGKHLHLSTRALWEGITKTLGGVGLTTVRLTQRQGIGAGFGGIAIAASLGGWVLLCGWLGTRSTWFRIWTPILFLSSAFYLAVPNINLGSEHYWYFPAVPLLCIFVAFLLAVSTKIVTQSNWFRWFCFGAYGLSALVLLQVRLLEMRSQVDFALAQLRLHPESKLTWSDAAMLLLASSHPPQVALPYLRKAKELLPRRAEVLGADFLFFFRTGDVKGAEGALNRIKEWTSPPKWRLASWHYHLSLLHARYGTCQAASHHLRTALQWQPENRLYRSNVEELRSMSSSCEGNCNKSVWCRRFAKAKKSAFF